MQRSTTARLTTEELRGILQEPARFKDIVLGTIRDWELERNPGSDLSSFGEHTVLSEIAVRSIDAIYQLAESPIEKLFFASLFMHVLMASRTIMLVLPSVPNAEESIVRRRERWMEGEAADAKIRKESNGQHDLLSIIRIAAERGEADEMHAGTFLMDRMASTLFHVFMQARLPAVKVNGRGIRLDALVWVPSLPNLKVAVECDGFQFHSDKQAFERDRKRDRALTAAGYGVFRFAGGEIWRDPVGAPLDLINYLFEVRRRAEETLQSE